jgi:hypothetical protein
MTALERIEQKLFSSKARSKSVSLLNLSVYFEMKRPMVCKNIIGNIYDSVDDLMVNDQKY